MKTMPHDPDERALSQCLEARESQEAYDYESARSKLSEWWPYGSDGPRTDGLGRRAAAEVKLRAGALIRDQGSGRQTPGSLARAEKLINESIRLFEQEGEWLRAADARAELALCRWLGGDSKAARRLLGQALDEMGDDAAGVRAKAAALLNAAAVEFSSGRLHEARDLLRAFVPLFDDIESPALLGRFHTNLGLVLNWLGEELGREDMLEDALFEYVAAEYYFKRAGAVRLLAHEKNNRGILHFTLGEFEEAADSLAQARQLFVELDDAGRVAQVEDTQAQLLIAQGRYEEAKLVAARAARTLEADERPAVLAEAYKTKAVALARSGDFPEARRTFERAIEIAELAGAREAAGLSALAAVEELCDWLDPHEARKLYDRASTLIEGASRARTLRLLNKAAGRVLAAADVRDASAAGPTPRSCESVARGAASIWAAASRLSARRSPALVVGESPEARRVVARLAHILSGRGGRFVAVDCEALEQLDALSEYVIFGGEGANGNVAGAAREAAGGTLFLDEVPELSRSKQKLLLRLIRDGVIQSGRHPSPRHERIDVRVVVGTSRDLSAEVEAGYFSAELFELLNACGPEAAPAAHELSQLRALVGCFIKDAVEYSGMSLPGAGGVLQTSPVETTAALATWLTSLSDAIAPTAEGADEGGAESAFVPPQAGKRKTALGGAQATFDEQFKIFESERFREALELTGGNVSAAARLLGMDRQRLKYRLKHHPELNGLCQPGGSSKPPADM